MFFFSFVIETLAEMVDTPVKMAEIAFQKYGTPLKCFRGVSYKETFLKCRNKFEYLTVEFPLAQIYIHRH
jgi:hypothetical protein